MSIIKSKHASNYTVLPNDIFKQGLSIQAIGLLAYLLSLPHDWVIRKMTLHKQLNMGRDSLDKVFKELQKTGYILTVKEVDSKNNFKYNHIVYDLPFNGEEPIKIPENTPITDFPLTEFPLTDFPLTENPQLLNKDIQSTKYKVKNTNNTIYPDLQNASTGTVNIQPVISDYNQCINYWLKEFHTDWTFNAMQGVKMKSIIGKIKKIV